MIAETEETIFPPPDVLFEPDGITRTPEALAFLTNLLISIRYDAFKASRLQIYDRKKIAHALVPSGSASFSALQRLIAKIDEVSLLVRPFPLQHEEFFALNWDADSSNPVLIREKWRQCIVMSNGPEEARNQIEESLRKVPLSNWRLTYPIVYTAY